MAGLLLCLTYLKLFSSKRCRSLLFVFFFFISISLSLHTTLSLFFSSSQLFEQFSILFSLIWNFFGFLLNWVLKIFFFLTWSHIWSGVLFWSVVFKSRERSYSFNVWKTFERFSIKSASFKENLFITAHIVQNVWKFTLTHCHLTNINALTVARANTFCVAHAHRVVVVIRANETI